ncbi:MAG: AsmA family protein [Candidatus Omnitrophica bacterium]|nr:AsmA family protein [Candidatus Omnitrophota bacterium]
MKYLNIKNIVIVLVILVLVHFSVGLLISPKLGDFIVGKINQYSSTKVSIERINIWPLIFSLSLKNVKVFDPQNTDNKIAEIKLVSIHISPLGLLSKRLVSEVKINGANIYLEGETDGTFNIQKLTQPKTSEKPATMEGIIKGALQKKDWFARGYDLLKKKFSSDALKKKKIQAAEAKKITKTVAVLPRGRRVIFKSKDSYLLEIKRLVVVGSYLDLKNQDGRSVQVEDARIEIANAAFDPGLGFRLGKAEVEGKIKSAGVAAGSLKFSYQSTFTKDTSKAQFNFALKNVNLDALRFIYENSLPVEISRGTLDLTSKTVLDNENINSGNQLILSNHELKPKGLAEPAEVFMPLPLLYQSLNNINPVRLDFTISGTIEKPQFKDFTHSLMAIVKPSLKNVGQTIKNEVSSKGISGVLETVSGEKEDKAQVASTGTGKEKSSTEDTVSALQSIFGNNKQDSK